MIKPMPVESPLADRIDQAIEDEGYVFCMPSSLTDDAAKDRFAEIARLFAIAHSARSLVMIVEAWAKLPDANGHLDIETPPSESSNRLEIVVLMLEDHTPATPPCWLLA